MPVFRKRPVEIEAVQFTGENYSEIFEFAGHIQISKNGCKIVTLEGIMEALPRDWIIKGVKGEFYPCKPDIFEATYEPVLDPNIQYPGKPDALGPFPEETE